MTEKDVLLMEGSLKAFRSQEDSPWLMNMLYQMRELWLPAAPTDAEKAQFYAKLEEHREKKYPSGRALLLYQMRSLGLDVKMTDVDREVVDDWLGVGRWAGGGEDRDAAGGAVLGSLYWLKKLGMPQDATESDKELIRMSLAKNRRERDGVALATMHHHMGELGIPHEVAPGDIRIMEEQLMDLRRRGVGDMVASMFNHLRRIFPPPEAGVSPQVPPLKEYTKR